MDTFKFDIATTGEPRWGEQPNNVEMGRATESIRTYVTSKMTGYKFLTDETLGSPFTVGSPADWQGFTHDGPGTTYLDGNPSWVADARLDGTKAS